VKILSVGAELLHAEKTDGRTDTTTLIVVLFICSFTKAHKNGLICVAERYIWCFDSNFYILFI